MIDHLALDVSDVGASRRFYAAALAPLGIAILEDTRNEAGDPCVLMGRDGVICFAIAEGRGVGRGTHVAFSAWNKGAVDAFHAAALGAGGRDNGAPGLRRRYGSGYYAAFALDQDGPNVEALCYLEDAR